MPKVPWEEWVTAFAIFNKASAKAAKSVADKYLRNVPGRTLLLLNALRKVALPRLRTALAQNPGVETPEQIANFIAEVVAQITPDEVAEAAKEVYVKLTGSEPSPEVLDAIRRAYQELRQNLPEYLQKVAREYAAARMVAA